MPKTEFDYYYGAESEQFSFIMIPQILFDDEEHFGSLSNDARMLYGILLNRMQLSRRNHWVDANNRVYIIYPMKKMAKRLKASLLDIFPYFVRTDSITIIKESVIYAAEKQRFQYSCDVI